MVKFILGIAIVAFTSFCGYVFGKKYRKRKLFFIQLREFNERFLNEITYYKRPLAEFSSKYVYKNEFGFLLETYFSNIEESPRAIGGIFEDTTFDFLSKEEKGEIRDYFSMLGKGDSISQKTYFSSVKERLLKLQAEAETACKKYGDLYVKLGFLFGLLILILIL